LIQLESDIRQHIRVEQQLKLHIEQMQNQSDEVYEQLQRKSIKAKSLEKEVDELRIKLKESTAKHQKELKSLQSRVQTKEGEYVTTIQKLEQSLQESTN
jgi:hypothetical protein